MRSGGLLVVSSGYQWREERTPRDLWLGGHTASPASTQGEKEKTEVKSAEVLVQRLKEDF